MLRIRLAMLLLSMQAAGLAQMPSAMPPWSKNQKVEVKGTIQRVQVTPGQGMPYLELMKDKRVQRVMLGSMRYLMEHNFNPKAGQVATVKGFLVDESIIAQSVSIPAEKVTIQLRDDNGVPLWRMGRWERKEK